jgi:acetyltransferase
MDVNPLLADARGVLALDARIRIAPASTTGAGRLAIRPYPKELEEWIEFDGGRALLRPIRPEDEPPHRDFLARITPGDLQLRFFHTKGAFEHAELARFTQIDYEREMAFIAVAAGRGGAPQTLGVVRAIADPDGASAEFGILVRSDLKGKGLGTLLMEKIVRYCRDRDIGQLVGDVLAANPGMLALARDLGFEIVPGPDPQVLNARLVLRAAARPAPAPRALTR